MDILIARRFVRAPAFTAAFLALALVAAVACRGVEEEEVPGRAALLTPETSPTSSLAPSPSPSPAPAPADLGPPAEGYTWYVSPPNDFGAPLYAVQVPSDWSLPGPFYGKFASVPEGATYEGPALIIGWAEASFLAKSGTPHPFYWDLPHQGGDCQQITEAGQEVLGEHTWNLFTFSCSTPEPGNRDRVLSFNGRAAEVRVGEFVFNILAKHPIGNTAADGPFQQALASFREQ